MPDVRLAYAPASMCGSLEHMPLNLCPPAAPREHDLRPSVSISSSDRPRRTSSPCTPPTTACVARRGSPFTGRFASTSALPLSHHRHGSSSRLLRLAPSGTGPHPRPLAMPSFTGRWSSAAPFVPNHTCEAAHGPSAHQLQRALTPAIRPRSASLTPACSGLAALAADASR